jgi:hypothetical protein
VRSLSCIISPTLYKICSQYDDDQKTRNFGSLVTVKSACYHVWIMMNMFIFNLCMHGSGDTQVGLKL